MEGKKQSVQVKFRENGSDVLFEIIKDVAKNIPGRDMISKADFYLVMDTSRIIRLFETQKIKEMALVIKNFVLGELAEHPNKTNWGSSKACNVKITVDGQHGNRKLMAYFNPSMLTCLGSWNYD